MKQRTRSLCRATAALCLGVTALVGAAGVHAQAVAASSANTNSAVGGMSAAHALNPKTEVEPAGMLALRPTSVSGLKLTEGGVLRNAGFERFRDPSAATNNAAQIQPPGRTDATSRADALLRRAKAEAAVKAGRFGLKDAPLRPASSFLQQPPATDAARMTGTGVVKNIESHRPQSAGLPPSSGADNSKPPAKPRTPSEWWTLRDRPFLLQPSAVATNIIALPAPSTPPMVPPPIVSSVTPVSNTVRTWLPPAFAQTPALPEATRPAGAAQPQPQGPSPSAMLVTGDLRLDSPPQPTRSERPPQPKPLAPAAEKPPSTPRPSGMQTAKPPPPPVAEKTVPVTTAGKTNALHTASAPESLPRPMPSVPSPALGSNTAPAWLTPRFVQITAASKTNRLAARTPLQPPAGLPTTAGPASAAAETWEPPIAIPAPRRIQPAHNARFQPSPATSTNIIAQPGALRPAPSLPPPGPLTAEQKRALELKTLMDEARAFFNQKKYEEAAEKYRTVLKRDPENLFGLSNLAVIRFQQDRLEEAEHLLNRALDIAPDDAYCRATIGIIYFKLDRLDDAIEELTTSLKLNPDNAEAHNYLGIASWKKGQSAVAERELQRAVAMRPDYLDANYNLVVIYTSKKMPFLGLAKFHYRKTLELGRAPDPELEKILASGKPGK
jgi:Flp pilus assembly protein TadD